uniref:AAA+ ATPase domain-containing protein n=1 Tax=Oncorhynchus mykiss TaxID=8022 RepID=A0A8K9V7R0_ONCMY
MDEYDEMFGIEDEYEQQFADELEVLAEMDCEERVLWCLLSLMYLYPCVAPKAKRLRQDVAKKLFEVSQVDDITPPVVSRGLIPVILDISGFAAIQESPRRVTAATSCHVLKRPPAEGGYVSVTDQTGNRVYLRQTDDMRGKILSFLYINTCLKHKRVCVCVFSQVDEEFGELDGRQREEGDREEEEEESSRLWVDQFSPQHYTELLSDDFTNRCLLKWLKLWDQVVFGRERKTRPPPGRGRFNSTNRSQGNFNQANQKFKTKSQITEELLEAELDQYKRPKYKVVLLSGPPGLGKTTLAHIIAKHAGYNVVEINASDDRSAELFQKRIDTATQMRSVLGANEKPNCLIIDEIDGAPAAAISILLATLNRKDSQGADSEAEPLKKKKKKESVLLRPIICICNDL